MLSHRLTLLLAALCAGPAVAQSIEITSAPPYGSPGSISGTVRGVDFATHRVAVFLHIDGAGWWTKPSAAAPTVSIGPNGAFTANVYTCCLDSSATIYHAALIAANATPTVANGACAIPANLPSVAFDTFERYGRTVQFAGRTWAIKQSDSPVGPGGNRFTDDPRDVFVDPQGRLHLRVVQRGGHWLSSEVVLTDEVGYGTYWFTTESQVGNLDPNLTFAAFTWDSFCDDSSIPAAPNREIDFEDSRWGDPSDPNSSQVVVQPYSIPGNTTRYNTPTLAPEPTLTRSFSWRRNRIDFSVAAGRHSPCSTPSPNVLHRSTYIHDPANGHRVPTAGREKFRFNFWINRGGAPLDGQDAEVVISDFRFSNTVGVFPAGCGINPPGSATVLSGGPYLGRTISLGIDNPSGTQRPGAIAALLLGLTALSPEFPCGLPLPGFGMDGPAGELLVSPLLSLQGGTWAGPGNPVPIQLTIPFDLGLLNVALYTQGVLVDAGGAVPIGLADAQELCIQL